MKRIILLLLFLSGCTSDVSEIYNESCDFLGNEIECSASFDEVNGELILKNNYDYDIGYESILIAGAGTCGREFIGEEKADGYMIESGEEIKLTVICNNLPKHGEKLESSISFRFKRGDNYVLTTLPGNLVAKIK